MRYKILVVSAYSIVLTISNSFLLGSNPIGELSWYENSLSYGGLTDPINGDCVYGYKVIKCSNTSLTTSDADDLIAWPDNDDVGIVFNYNNGYAAFSNDFETLTKPEIELIKEWLNKNYNSNGKYKNITYIEKLKWLEKLYSLRNYDNKSWCRLYRLISNAYKHEKNERKIYLKKALDYIYIILNEQLNQPERLSYIYLACRYNYEISEYEKYKHFLQELKRFNHDYEGSINIFLMRLKEAGIPINKSNQ